jgi:hypothetical protein
MIEPLGRTMKARQLIRNGSYGPDQLKVLFKAFDDAWDSIAANFGSPLAIEAARIRLANIILSLPHDGSCDPEQIKNAAIRIMELGDRK